jgi:phage tail sheath protein FI
MTFLAAERYCGRRKAMLIWDPPWSWTSPDAALLGLRQGGYASPNAMTYYPRVSPAASPERHPQGVPAGGAVAGLLATMDRTGDWHVDGELHRHLRAGLVPQTTIDERRARVLARRGINVFSPRPPHGALFVGNVSLASTSGVSRLWQRLDRRRMVSFVLKSLERHTRWVLRVPWDRAFEQRLVAQVSTFLEGLFDRGAFAGRRPEQAFFVKIQGAVQGDDRELVLRIGLALDRPGDFLQYDIVHGAGSSLARPAPPQNATQLAG